MKYLLFFLFPLFPLFAEEFDDIAFYEEAATFHPFGITGTTLNVNPTHFYTPGFEDKTLTYFQSDAAFAFTYPCNKCCGFMFGMSWVGTNVDVQDNPDFTETFFNYLAFSAGGFTSSYSNWLWTINLTLNVDMAEINLSDYALFQGVLWGKYITSCFEFDVGTIVEVGLNKEKIWPIIGFGYTPFSWTRLKIVYPVDISLEVDVVKELTIAGSIRFLRNRHRTLANNPNPMCIFEYLTTGAEFDAIFTPIPAIEIIGFVGKTFDGNLKISNNNDKDPTHYKFRGSLYFGGSMKLIF